jgi:uncharacterized membrane protein
MKLSNRYKLALLTLCFMSAVAVSMVAVRYFVTEQRVFLGLVWNLFLAWVPLVFALLAIRTRSGLLMALFTGLWLLFFPNAPYILTDIIHFYPRDHAPYWYDLVLILSFAWTGFLLGYLSLYILHKRVAKIFGPWVGWGFTLISLALGSFGIYLGRFERFNSWDLITAPGDLLADIYMRIRHPFDNLRTYGVSILFMALLLGLYLTLYAFSSLPREAEQTSS